ncbi:MAG: hypothetical protein QOD30_1129 [Actinomycetota bacterium]|nr:hypothetical protein [Actinomycetota bacterium]
MADHGEHTIGTRPEPTSGRTMYVATCTCGWESRPLSTAGMAAGAGAQHRDEPTRHFPSGSG